MKSRSDGNILQSGFGSTRLNKARPAQNNEVPSVAIGATNKQAVGGNSSPRSIGAENKQTGDHYFDDAKFGASQDSNTDSELEDSQGDISSDGGDYQDLPIIVESPQGEQSQTEQGKQVDPNDLLKSRSIKSSNKNLQTYEDAALTQDLGGDGIQTKRKKSRVIDKRSFDMETSKA